MAKIEVDEAEYNNMVALRGVAAKMVAKPESRRLLEQAQKLVDPNAPTPLLDQEAAQLAPVKELEKTVNERLQEIMDDSFDSVVQYAGTHRVNNRTAAYMLALDRVANAIRLRGIYA